MPLDIGMGILLSLFVADYFSITATPVFILLGIFFALLPDIDIFWYWFGKPKLEHDHRSFTHFPLLYIFLTPVVYIFFGPVYGTLFALCVAMHLIHDTIGMGWGIAWFAPFSYRKFRFLSQGGHGGSWELFRTWLPHEEAALAKHQHDPQWFTTYYLRPNLIGFVEYTVFCIALAVLLFYVS